MRNKNKSVLEKYKGLDFATAASKIEKKYPHRSVNNQEMAAYKAELKQLQKAQDKQRLAMEAQQVFKMGGKLPKYELGTLSTDPLSSVYDLAKTIYDAKAAGQSLSPIMNRSDAPAVSPVGEPELSSGILNYTIPDSGPTSTMKDAPIIKSDKSVFTPALIGKALETGINLSQLAGGYDKFDPIENPNASDIERTMASRGIDKTAVRNQLMSAFNAARSNNQRARSANVANALDTNLLNQTQDSLEKLSLDEQGINIGLKTDYANTLNNLGQQSVQAQERSRLMTAQSKGNFQTELSKAGMAATDLGKFISDVRTNKQNQQTIANILNMKYGTMGIDKSVTDRLLSGKMTQDDIIKLNNAVGTQMAETLIEAFKYKED